MGLLIGTAILICSIVLCVVNGVSPVYALILGEFIFCYLAYRQGSGIADIRNMLWKGATNAGIVVVLLVIIGFLTASWRMSGTICYFVYYGVKFIRPATFLFVGYVLSSVLSYAVGSSFATTASVGVIFMALARAGGVNELLVGGMILSGIYMGDRASPSSSASMLVASVTKTDHMHNVKNMAKFTVIPFAISLAIYGYLSVKNPIASVDNTFLTKLAGEFVISHWCLIPALIMLILPFAGVDIIKCMTLSVATGVICSLTIQKVKLGLLLRTMIVGYTAESDFGVIFNGGGLMSMMDVIIIVILTGALSGIFDGTGMLNSVKDKIGLMMDKTGKFFTVFVIGNIVAMIGCNQVFPTVASEILFVDPYLERGATREELASDIQNSFLITVGIIPWVIANSVPRSFMGVGTGATLYAFYIFLVPLCYAFSKPVYQKVLGKKF